MGESAWKRELAEACRRLIEGCKTTADTGETLYTPDGSACYGALWTRDFAYMAEYAPAHIPLPDVVKAVDYLAGHPRADGWIPDRVDAKGVAVYSAGPVDCPAGEANLDNGPFLVFAADAAIARMADYAAGDAFYRWREPMRRGLDVIPMKDGLVFNPDERPHSPYGFTDTICKTGELFFESLLYWRAARKLAVLCARFGEAAEAGELAARADEIARNVARLRDERTGMFFAASGKCRQIDIWGAAYALAIGFPLPEAWKRAMEDYLAARFDEIVFEGQVRHLPGGEHWEALLLPTKPEEYQNGAYWATASGWLYAALKPRYPALAERLMSELCLSFRTYGVFECVNRGGYRKLDLYVVSATNPFGAL